MNNSCFEAALTSNLSDVISLVQGDNWLQYGSVVVIG